MVLVANDSDVLFLGGYACALDKSRNWFYNYEGGTYADLAKFAGYYGDLCLYLPMFHSITGCDTTSYFHYRGKTIPWNRALKNPSSLLLIKDLGKEITPSETTLVECMEFVRIYVYSGLPNEDLVTTKVRLYEAQVVKKTSTLPPDPNSLRYDILRKHHQAYIWRHCTEPTILQLPFQQYGWQKVGGCLMPIWYTCPQLPKCLRKYDKSGYDAEIEDPFPAPTIEFVEPVALIVESSSDPEPPGKRFRRNLRESQSTSKDEDPYCADDEAALENTSWSWPNFSESSESDWNKLSSSSGMDSSDDTEDPDWER